MQHSEPPATLRTRLIEHLIAMRNGTDKTTPQPESARDSLKKYNEIFKDWPEFDLAGGIKAAMEKT